MKPVPRHLGPGVRGVRPSATLAINERSLELEAQGKEIFRLGLGQSPFPVPDFVVDALKRHAHEKDYLPVAGLPELRLAVAKFHARREKLEAKAENVLIGPGSKELLFLAQLCFGGELLIPSPSWVSYEPQANILGLGVTWIGTSVENSWKLQARDLREKCLEAPERPRLLILNYPNNPSGVSYDEEELRELAEVCREFGILVISDEIYGEVHHRGEHVSLSRFHPEGTIISGGLSKWCGAGGWRLGTFLFPDALSWLREAMAVVASETFTSVAAPIQWAAVQAYQDGPEICEYLDRSRRVLRAVGRYCYQQLLAFGALVPEPDGGFYLFPDCSSLAENLASRGIHTAADLSEALLEKTGVAVLPGSDFGRAPEELIFRMAYVNFDGELALSRIDEFEGREEAFVPACCPAVVEAMKRIGGFLK